MTAHVLLVHGLWGGAWCWDAVRERLDAREVPSRAVDLPMRALQGDAEVVRRCLDRLVEPVVLVGHSYGGAVITAAGDHRAVGRLVYFAAFQLAEHESISRLCTDRALPPPPLDMRPMVRDTEVAPDPVLLRPALYGPDVPGTVADAALARMRPVARTLFRDVPAAVAWRNRPSTYVVCTRDRTVHPQLQRAMAERADDVRTWPSDHSPLTSRPDAVAELLAELAGQ